MIKFKVLKRLNFIYTNSAPGCSSIPIREIERLDRSRTQGPKLTFLGRRQVATEIFFSVAKWKNVVAKKAEKKSVNKIFPSQRNTNHIFGLPDGKFWSPIFLLRIRTKRTRLPGAAMAKNHDKRIECRLYTRLLNVLSRLNTFSCLYLLEKKYTRF